MTIASPNRRKKSDLSAIPAQPLAPPRCDDCGTDAFLIFEDFIPAAFTGDDSGLLPPSVSYVCSNCGDFSAHDVPYGWSPAGWHWYS
jgi:hypothetical protein